MLSRQNLSIQSSTGVPALMSSMLLNNSTRNLLTLNISRRR